MTSKIVRRAIKAAFMNFAYKQLPTESGTWGTDPTGLAKLTDGDLLSRMAIAGVTTTTLANIVNIKVDVGQVIECYQIVVHNIAGKGCKSNNAANAGTITLQTSVDDTNWTARGTVQTPAGTAFEDMTVGYDGEGIPVRYARLLLENDDTYTLTIDISEIEVMGS